MAGPVPTIDADAESRAWIAELRREGPERDQAIARLHALVLRAARFEVGRRARAIGHLRGGDLDDIALQSANDALVDVREKRAIFCNGWTRRRQTMNALCVRRGRKVIA